MNVTFRRAGSNDAPAIHRLIVENLEVGHLLPRSLEDVTVNAPRFLVAESDGQVVGCAELAPLSAGVAEVRSLVVDQHARGRHIGPQLVAQLASLGESKGFGTLCAFTHDPSHFVRLGFTIVPHMWVPEKIERDCRTCSYAAWLDCDGNCGECPHNGYCPCVNPVVARSKTALRIIELRPLLLQDLRARG